LPSEPSAKAIAENLRTLVKVVDDSALAKIPVTPGGDVTVADVIKFIVPQSEVDLGLEAVGGPVGKGAGMALKPVIDAVTALGLVKRATPGEITSAARAGRRMFEKNPRSRDRGMESLLEVLEEMSSGPVILDKRGGRAGTASFDDGFPAVQGARPGFDPLTKIGEEVADTNTDELVGALVMGKSPEEINRVMKLVDEPFPPLSTRKNPGAGRDVLPRARRSEMDVGDAEREMLGEIGDDAQAAGDFVAADTIISPKTGERVFLEEDDIELFLETLLERRSRGAGGN
jgi:hypothetical protein